LYSSTSFSIVSSCDCSLLRRLGSVMRMWLVSCWFSIRCRYGVPILSAMCLYNTTSRLSSLKSSSGCGPVACDPIHKLSMDQLMHYISTRSNTGTTLFNWSAQLQGNRQSVTFCRLLVNGTVIIPQSSNTKSDTKTESNSQHPVLKQ